MMRPSSLTDGRVFPVHFFVKFCNIFDFCLRKSKIMTTFVTVEGGRPETTKFN